MRAEEAKAQSPRLAILAEIEDVIRSMPSRDELHLDSLEVLQWIGRATAAMNNWKGGLNISWDVMLHELHEGRNPYAPGKLIRLLYEAQHDLRMKTIGPINLAIGHGHVFDYVDTIRRILEQARDDVLFVDRYLFGDFVATYLPFIHSDVSIRLLAWSDKRVFKNLKALCALSAAYSEQHATKIEVRSHSDHHERLLVIDRRVAYLSGASFKDGPKTAGATIIQQSGEAQTKLISEHEQLWSAAQLEFPTG
jgi:hypothetical protein